MAPFHIILQAILAEKGFYKALRYSLQKGH